MFVPKEGFLLAPELGVAGLDRLLGGPLLGLVGILLSGGEQLVDVPVEGRRLEEVGEPCVEWPEGPVFPGVDGLGVRQVA